jgi:iron complex outermembrane receptor protein
MSKRQWGVAKPGTLLASAVALLAAAPCDAVTDADREEFPAALKRLSLEELTNVDVTTESRAASSLFETPAAAYVITRDEIRRSGVKTIAEALRLAPGVEVARDNTYSWNVSIRGFNGDLSNKLLVLMDGRSVYSPLFAGVFWDAQDYLLEDIDRIEVIAGPGGTMWGANAVNGIINIITRPAGASSGGFAFGGGGNEENMAGLRLSTELGETWQGRAYLKYFDRDPSQPLDGSAGIDTWRGYQGGFRADGGQGADHYTVQGDFYDGTQHALYNRDFTLGTLPGDPFVQQLDIGGHNLLGRWTRRRPSGSEVSLQAYYDRTERDLPQTYTERRDTLDLDFQHVLRKGGRHEVVWGAGARYTEDSIDNSEFAAFLPPSRGDWTVSAFAQDRMNLYDGRFFLTAGAKVEHNDYTGFEFQPSLAFTVLRSERQTLWTSVSRAVRIPARLDADLQLTAPFSIPGLPVPLFVRVDGSDDFDSEEVWAYEAGWRGRVGTALTLDVAAFHNDYRDLQTQEPLEPAFVPGPPAYLFFPNVLANGKDARSNGVTLAANYQPTESLRLRFSYTWFELDVSPHADSNDQAARAVEGNSPRHQAAMHAFVDLPRHVSVYAGLRYVDALPSQGVDEYFALDVNFVWRVNEAFEMSLAGRNVLDPGHREFGSPNELERSAYGQLTWRF